MFAAFATALGASRGPALSFGKPSRGLRGLLVALQERLKGSAESSREADSFD